jgi:hypothetical protein
MNKIENVAGGAAKPIKPQHHQLVAPCRNCIMVSSSDRPFRDAPDPVSDLMISQPAAFRRWF